MEYIIMAIVILYILSSVVGGLNKTGGGRTPPPGQGPRKSTPSGMPSFGGTEFEPKPVEAHKPVPHEIPSEVPRQDDRIPFDIPWVTSEYNDSEAEKQPAAHQQAPIIELDIADQEMTNQDYTKSDIRTRRADDDKGARRMAAQHPLFNKESIVHGVIWSEILSPPKSRRR